MTREEEIREAAYKRYCNDSSVTFGLQCNCFGEGAKWAEQQIIKKACDLYREELIQFNNLLSHLNSDYDGLVDIEKSIKSFKKAIEE